MNVENMTNLESSTLHIMPDVKYDFYFIFVSQFQNSENKKGSSFVCTSASPRSYQKAHI